MPVTVGDVFQVTMKGTLLGQTIMNTFHYGMSVVTGAPTQTAVQNEILVKLAVAGGFYDKFLDILPGNYTLDEVWVQFILDTRYRKRVAVQGLNGTFGQDSEVTNIAAVASRFGDAANRRNQGSVHFAIGGSGSWIVGGLISAGVETKVNAFLPHLYTAQALATLGTIQPILIHGTSKLNAIPLTSAVTQLTSRVMRRRTVGLGI